MTPQTDARPSRPPAAGDWQPAAAHLDGMLDSLSDGFMSLDRSWRFTYLNHTAARYLQQTRENLLGREIWQCFPDLADTDYGRVYRETAATGQPGQHTGYYAPLGTWFEVRSFAATMASPCSFATFHVNTSTRRSWNLKPVTTT